MFDEVNIKKTLEAIDLELRPQALYFHPSRAKDLKYIMPDIEEKVLLVPTIAMSEDVMFLVDRKELETYYKPGSLYQSESLE